MTTPAAAHEQRNFWAFGLDFVFFSLAIQFFNPNTTIPAFASRLFGSTAIVGVIATFFNIVWSVPQLFAGNIVSGRVYKKPVLMTAARIGRPAVLVLAVIIFLTGGEPAWLILALLLTAIATFLMTDAFAAVAWLDMLGRAFPSERRGGNISLWQVGKGIGVLGVGYIAGLVLSANGPGFPANYALLFGAAGCCLLVSYLSLSRIVEPPPEEDSIQAVEWQGFARRTYEMLRGDDRLRRVTIVRVLFQFSMMAFPFYVTYATNVLAFPEETIGVFIAAQTVGTLLASLLLGRIANRFGERQVIILGVMIVMLAPVIGLLFTAVEGLPPLAYSVIYICIGIGDNLIVLGFINYVVAISPPGLRPTYAGATNALGSIGALGAILAGLMVDWLGYPHLFMLSLLLSVVVLVLSIGLPSSR